MIKSNDPSLFHFISNWLTGRKSLYGTWYAVRYDTPQRTSTLDLSCYNFGGTIGFIHDRCVTIDDRSDYRICVRVPKQTLYACDPMFFDKLDNAMHNVEMFYRSLVGNY